MDETMTPMTDRPLVTFALFAYNQEKYIREAVEGAFSQTYEPLEIILSDDCSSDRTFEIMQEMVSEYDGPHSVVLRRNNENIGLVPHVNKIFEIAKSEYIVAAAGDDISLPGRVKAIQCATYDSPLLLHSDYWMIDLYGKEVEHARPTEEILASDISKIAISRSLYVGATGVWHKDLYRKFGPINSVLAYEDLVMGYRASLAGKAKYLDEKLVRYRVGSGMTSGTKNDKTKRIRRTKARIAALMQRAEDTRRIAPDRCDLLQLIHRQIEVEQAILAYHERFWFFLRLLATRRNVFFYFLRKLAR